MILQTVHMPKIHAGIYENICDKVGATIKEKGQSPDVPFWLVLTVSLNNQNQLMQLNELYYWATFRKN